jgi:hypothetical protein
MARSVLARWALGASLVTLVAVGMQLAAAVAKAMKFDVYERVVGRAFEHVAVSSTLKTDTVPQARRPDQEGADELALARIKQEREQAALRFAKERDLGRLEATMARG